MILDALDLPPHQREIETELCIVGSGPAALVVCREMLSTGVRAPAVLESGGLAYENTSQNLNAGRVVGAAYTDLRNARRRQVGGTVNIWNTGKSRGKVAAKYVPLDAIDFECRDWVPHSGWPFGSDELDDGIGRRRSLRPRPIRLRCMRLDTSGSPPPLSLDERLHDQGLSIRHGRPVHRSADRDVARQQASATVFSTPALPNSVADRRTDRVSAALIAVPERRERIRVNADTFVLAAGAIENARLLLLSDASRSAGRPWATSTIWLDVSSWNIRAITR